MVNRYQSIILIGLILAAGVLSHRTTRKRSQARHVSSYLYNQLETLFDPNFAHVVRPIYNKWEDFHFGLTFGFSNVDLDVPFYCLAEGPNNAAAGWNLFWKFLDTWDTDVYANVYDVMIPL
jgi:hypothetical protein